MNKELPQPTIVTIIAIAMILVAGIGWFYMNHNSDHVATVAGQHGAMATGPGAGSRTRGKPSD